MIRDITKKKLAEETLKASQEYAKSVIDSSLYMIIAVDKDRKIIEFSKAAEKTFGYRPEEILGKPIDVLYVDPREGLTINNVTHEKGRFTGEILNRRKNGETFPSFLDSSVLRNARGEQVGVMGISWDISERKQAEKALKFTQFAIDRAGELAYWMDSQARFFYVNDAACRSLGYSREELLSMTVHDINPWFSAESWPKTWEEVKKRRCFTFESHHRTKHGRKFPVEITINYMEFEGKEYNCAFARDITKRKQAEEALSEMNIALANVMPGISQLDIQGRYVNVNEAYARMMGVEPRELIGSDWKPTVHPDDQGEAISAYEHMLRDGKAEFEARTVRKDSSVFYKHALMVKIVDKDDNFIGHHCFMRDISVRKRAQDQIERHRQRLAALHEIDLAITSTLDLRSVLDLLLGKIDLLLPYSVTTLRLLNEETGLLEAVAARNVDEEEWKTTMREGGRGFSKSVLKNKTPVIIANVQKNTNAKYPEFLRKYGLISYLGVPLIAKDIILGTLGFYTKEEHEFSKEEVELLFTLAGQAAIAIHNSQLFQQAENRTRELTALQAVTAAASESLHLNTVLHEVVKKVTEIFHFDATRIFLFDPRANELHLRASIETNPEFSAYAGVFRRGQGNVGKVFETGEALVFEDVQSDPRYGKSSHTKNTHKAGFSFFAAFPIKSKQTIIGTIVCIGKDARRLKPDEIRLIMSVAGQIGVAVENATLFQETVTRAKELSVLNSISTVVNKSLDLDSILGDVMYDILEIFHFDAARIYLFDGDRKELRLKAQQGFPKDFNPTASYKPGQGLIGRVFETGEPILFDDIQNSPEFRRLSSRKTLLRAGFHGHFSIPIGVKGRTVGVMNFVSKEPHYFSPSENQLIHSIANHVGISVENARLYENTKNQALQLEEDITERKRAEAQLKQANAELAGRETALRDALSNLKATQLQLIQAEKLESVGRLAAGVAHEVKNPLAIMLQGIHYLSKHLTTNGDNVTMALQDMDNAVKRADSVVRGLLDFSAPSELSLNTEELNFVVEQSLSLVRHELDKYHVNVVRELSEHLPAVRLDRNKIEQVFVNIFLNAVHAMPDGGTLTIKTYTKRLTKVAPNGGSRKADHFRIGQIVVMVEVEDTGTGIPKDKVSEVFDPFFTTKSTGKGTGLGLAVTKKIIDLHGGTINIGNRKEGGARVTIMFKERGGKDHEEETNPAH